MNGVLYILFLECGETHLLRVIAVDEEVVAFVEHDVVRALVQDLGRRK